MNNFARWNWVLDIMLTVWASGVVQGQTTRYVALSGDGSDGLSWATARTSLQTAIDDAVSDDIILVKTGLYVQASATLIDGKNLTIEGGYHGIGPEPGAASTDPNLTVLDADAVDRVLTVSNCTSGVIANLTLQNGLVDGHGGGVYISFATNMFLNCIIRDNRLNGSEKQGAGVYLGGVNTTFERCVIRDNTQGPSTGTRYGGGLAMGAGNLTMVDCEMSGNQARYNGTMRIDGAGTAVFSNCLFRSNRDPGTGGSILTRKTQTIFNFCTVADNATLGSGIYRYGGVVSVTNSIIWNNGIEIAGAVTISDSCIKDPSITGPGVIHDDPQLIADYYLADSSPCVNAAVITADEVGLTGTYAMANTSDTGLADLGYHHAVGFTIAKPDLYVNAAGGDDGNGGAAPDDAFKTVTHALAVAEVGSHVHVAEGIYNLANGETFPLAFSADSVHLLGENAETTILDATGAGTRVMNVYEMGGSTLIRNLTFTGGNDANYGGGIYLRGTSARFEDCVIRDNQLNGGGDKNGIGIYLDSGSPVFVGCYIINNRLTTATVHGGGANLKGAPKFERCVFSGNTCNSYGGAILFSGSRLEMENCLIVSNNYTGGKVLADGIQVTSGQAIFNHVTFADNLGYGLVRSGGTVAASNSIFWGNGVDVTGEVSLAWCNVENGDFTDLGGNTNLPPLFADNVFYHLDSRVGRYDGGYFTGGTWTKGAAESPLIDLADPNAPYDLEPSPNGKRANMGAYGNTLLATKTRTISGTVLMFR